MKKILFVCSGNTCRSPMAEGFFNHLAKQNGQHENMRAVSAGLHAFEGSPVNERSRVASFHDHIDLSAHLSRPVSTELVDESFLILTMTREHKDEMIERFPQCKNKVYTLKEFVGSHGDIHDPLGLGDQVYDDTYREIKGAVEKLFEKVKQNESCSWK